jgi:hypothetical protein
MFHFSSLKEKFGSKYKVCFDIVKNIHKKTEKINDFEKAFYFSFVCNFQAKG